MILKKVVSPSLGKLLIYIIWREKKCKNVSPAEACVKWWYMFPLGAGRSVQLAVVVVRNTVAATNLYSSKGVAPSMQGSERCTGYKIWRTYGFPMIRTRSGTDTLHHVWVSNTCTARATNNLKYLDRIVPLAELRWIGFWQINCRYREKDWQFSVRNWFKCQYLPRSNLSSAQKQELGCTEKWMFESYKIFGNTTYYMTCNSFFYFFFKSLDRVIE